MNAAIAILNENGLHDVASVEEFVCRRSKADLLSIIEGLREAITNDSRESLPTHSAALTDDANFLPSSSFRGGSGCCHWNCRIPKLQMLARYVALYCDRAIVPFSFRWEEEDEQSPTPGQLNSEALGRISLGGSLCSLVELKPLIENGIVIPIPEELHFCKDHWRREIPGSEKILKATEHLAQLKADKFKVYLSPRRTARDLPHLSFRGPEEYLDHGSAGVVFDHVPQWISKRKRTRTVRIPTGIVRKHKLLVPIFRQMANDAFLQAYFGKAFNARYVTDLPGEIEFLRALNFGDPLALQTAALCARLTHSIPLLSEIPLETVMKVRRDDPLAFENYRSALTNIVKTHVRDGRVVGPKEADEIYQDVLRPRLSALENQARNLRRTTLKRGLLKAAASSVLLGLGIYTGVLPSDLSKLVTAVGGFNVARDLAEALGAIETNPGEVRNHNLYFLLRLKQSR